MEGHHFIGHLAICKFIIERIGDKNHKSHIGCTPLQYAAMNGHLEVCQYIMKKVGDKNPKNKTGRTPLQKGDGAVYQYIMANVKDKNPKDNYGRTPYGVHMEYLAY